jgi:hypothetical protein
MSMSDETSPLPLVAGAAETSSVETAAAIGRAAEMNDDPEVAEVLDEAAIAAEATVGRVGWLRSVVERLFARPA